MPTHAVLCLDYKSMSIFIPILACPTQADDNPIRVHTIKHQTTQKVPIKTHKTSINEVNYANHIKTRKKKEWNANSLEIWKCVTTDKGSKGMPKIIQPK